MVKRLLLLALSVVFLSVLITPAVVNAGAKSKAELAGPIMLDGPITFLHPEYLSSSAWLALTGQDPALGLEKRVYGEGLKDASSGSALQAVGGAASALIPFRSPAAKFSRNILISQDLGRYPYQTEPHISVNPNDPDHLVVAMIDYNFPGVTSYVSIDGGATWDGPNQPKIPRGQYSGVGDPVTAFDSEGNVYVVQMSMSIEDFQIGGIWGSLLLAGIDVSRSVDGGYTWENAIVASPGEIFTQNYQVPEGEKSRGELWTYFVDKPWITIGPDPTNPDKEIIYVSYTLFVEVYTLAWLDELPALEIVEEIAVIEMVRSDDGGATWSQPFQVSPAVNVNPQGAIPGRLVHGSQPMVDPDGTVHVAYIDTAADGTWKGNGEIWVASSTNRGQSFSQRTKAAEFLELDILPRSSSFRLWGTGFPQTTVGLNGELYITYVAYPSDRPSDSGDVFMVASTNGGATWSQPIRVNDDDTTHLQFFPSITTDPSGDLHMMWADTRDDPSELAYHIYYSTSTDNGQTWEFNSRVSDFPSNPNFAFPGGSFIGDYFSITASSNDVYMVWADSRMGEVTGLNQKIAFARQRLMPSPTIFLSPPSGPSGRDITIQGSNFQPETEIFIDVGGVLTATSFTNKDGGFTTTIFAPISGEGARDVIVRDISGNVAAASFFTEFGFDSFQTEMANLNARLDELSLDQAPAAADTSTNGDSFPWLTALLAGALLITLATSGALWYRLRTVANK